MTAAAAVEGIRQVDSAGGIGIISAEPDAPYNRPPLSKSALEGKTFGQHLAQDGRQTTSVEMHLGCVAREIVPSEKQLRDRKGRRFPAMENFYSPPAAGPAEASSSSTTIRLSTFALCQTTAGFALLPKPASASPVIGAGFIGSEIAAALTLNGKQVVLIFPGHKIGERVFPQALAKYVSSFYQQKGVELLAGRKGCRLGNTRPPACP